MKMPRLLRSSPIGPCSTSPHHACSRRSSPAAVAIAGALAIMTGSTLQTGFVTEAAARIAAAGHAVAGDSFVAGESTAPPVFSLPPAANPQEQAIQDLLARQVTRIALMDLRAVAEPTQADYDAAVAALGIAHALAPGNQEILRNYMAAAYNAGNDALVLDLTRRLLDLDPADTVAWLRLVSTTIANRHQTADDRLLAYEALLGEQGRGLDAAIRSRLALDAALLLRERGDEAGFLRKLTLSAQLDPSHKEAAALAANLIAASEQGPTATLEALSLLLMADPVDPHVHLGMARLLAANGAFESARRFHTNGLRILQIANAAIEENLVEGRILQWHVEGPAAVAEGLARELLLAQDNVARAIRVAEQAKEPVDGIERPENIRFPVRVAVLAVLSAQAAGDDAAAVASLAAMTDEIASTIQGIESLIRRGEIEQERADQLLGSSILQLQTIRLWAGQQLDLVAADLESNRAFFNQHHPDSARMSEGWLAIRTGNPEAGMDILAPYVEGNMFALLGRATAYEKLEQIESAVADYKRILRIAPLEVSGAWARTRLKALGHDDDRRQAAALERIAAGVPRWVDRMITNPREFVQLSATIPNPSLEGTDQNRVIITIRNLSPIPLALGADRAINSRMLLAPKMEFEGANPDLVQPEVVDLDRRLRLMPRESIEVEVWPDAGLTGWISELLANRSIRVRWRVIQGFLRDSVGGYRPGPLSQVAETPQVVRRPHPEATLPPQMLANRITGDPVHSLPGLAGALRTRLVQPTLAPLATDFEELPGQAGRPRQFRLRTEQMEALRPAVQALANRYPTLPPVHRATLVALMPHSGFSPYVAAFEQFALADTDPLVMSIVLLTRLSDQKDHYLTRAAESGDEHLQWLAAAVAERLAVPAEFYSRLAPAAQVEGQDAVNGGGARR